MSESSETNKVYHAFGLNISSDIAFLDMAPVKGVPDVVIVYGELPDHIPDARITGVRYEAGPGSFLLRVDGIARYYVTERTSIVVEREPGAADPEYTEVPARCWQRQRHEAAIGAGGKIWPHRR